MSSIRPLFLRLARSVSGDFPEGLGMAADSFALAEGLIVILLIERPGCCNRGLMLTARWLCLC